MVVVQFSDDGAPTYIPDYEPAGSDTDDTLFGTESLSNYSMSTLSSDEVADYFHLVHGLPYSIDENILLFLPVLATTVQARVITHAIARLSQDGTNVPPEADQALRVLENHVDGARVLDLFTNDGTWVKEMAETYSNASFLSIDVKPFTPHIPHSRITYEVYDFYAGIAEPDSSFDVVHTFNCAFETKDFNFMLREMHRVLKPNGVLVIAEIPFHSYDGNNPLEMQSSDSHHATGLAWVRKAFEMQGIDVNVWDDLSTRLSPRHSLWTERTVDVNSGIIEQPTIYPSTRGFSSICQRTRLIPTSPWPEDKGQCLLGAVTCAMITQSWRMFDPLLIMVGLRPDEIDVLDEMVRKELMESKFKGYLKCHRWSARKL